MKTAHTQKIGHSYNAYGLIRTSFGFVLVSVWALNDSILGCNN